MDTPPAAATTCDADADAARLQEAVRSSAAALAAARGAPPPDAPADAAWLSRLRAALTAHGASLAAAGRGAEACCPLRAALLLSAPCPCDDGTGDSCATDEGPRSGAAPRAASPAARLRAAVQLLDLRQVSAALAAAVSAASSAPPPPVAPAAPANAPALLCALSARGDGALLRPPPPPARRLPAPAELARLLGDGLAAAGMEAPARGALLALWSFPSSGPPARRAPLRGVLYALRSVALLNNTGGGGGGGGGAADAAEAAARDAAAALAHGCAGLPPCCAALAHAAAAVALEARADARRGALPPQPYPSLGDGGGGGGGGGCRGDADDAAAAAASASFAAGLACAACEAWSAARVDPGGFGGLAARLAARLLPAHAAALASPGGRAALAARLAEEREARLPPARRLGGATGAPRPKWAGYFAWMDSRLRALAPAATADEAERVLTMEADTLDALLASGAPLARMLEAADRGLSYEGHKALMAAAAAAKAGGGAGGEDAQGLLQAG